MNSSEITSTEWTLIRFSEPFFHAAPVENVLTWKFFDEFILLKSLDADWAGPGTLLHDHCLYPKRLLLKLYLGVRRDLVDGVKGNDIS